MMPTVPGNPNDNLGFLHPAFRPTQADLLQAASITHDRLQRLAMDVSEMRKSTNIEPGGEKLQRLKAEIPPEERGGTYQEEVDEAARDVGSVEGKRMKPMGGRL